MDFLPAERCTAIREELGANAGEAAPVYGTTAGGAVDPLVRRVMRLAPSAETRQAVMDALNAAREPLSRHFGVTLTSFEEPQFLRYGPGDHFVAHQDGNTPLIFDDTRHRRVSAVIPLSRPTTAGQPGDYSGGALVFHQPGEHIPALVRPGQLLAFRSELTHEVTPLEAGERYTIVTWYR